MTQRKFEIHMHSCHSDGEFSPRELVSIARKNNVNILSLTDHDTFSGIDDFIQAAETAGIFAFPGIEMTVRYHDYNLHLLGYFKSVDSISPDLRDRVERMKQERDGRMIELIARINQVVPDRFKGKILYENVKKGSEGVLARPHLAREMVRLGIVESTREAFEKYLVKYNVERENVDIETALKMIRQSRGVPIMAHPGERTYSLCNAQKGHTWEQVPERVAELKEMGLMGLECVYPYHEKTGTVNYFLELARQFGMIATGSRDFHGYTTYQKPEVLGTTVMDDSFLQQFREIWG